MRAALLLLVILLAAAAPAQAGIEPDHVASADVSLVENIRLPGTAHGAGLHGERLVVTGPSHLTVFDASDPAAPELLGVAPLGAANETEDVAGDGRWAAVAERDCLDPLIRGGCIAVFDVTGAPRRISSLGMSVQTVACVLDCRYLWAAGDNAIVDMAQPAAPKLAGTFVEPNDVRLQGACRTTREVRPGVVMAACDPALALSTLAEHGGSPTRPVLLARADTRNFTAPAFGGLPLGAHWPGGGDRYMLTSTQTPVTGTCGGSQFGALVLWDAKPVLAGGDAFTVTDVWQPSNGTYVDGRSPYNALGCSPHYFAEHPTFGDGGLVAVAALENGLRFLQVGSDGTFGDRGYFLGAGGTAALPVWHPDGHTLYLVDYARGLDVLAYTGLIYLPRVEPPELPPSPPPRARQPTAPPAFYVLGLVRNERGRATLAVETPGPGRITATARARGVRFPRLVADVRHGGLTTLTIAATGKASAVLRRRGRLAVDVRIAWKPVSGPAATVRKRLVLRARR
jgi:hypothetical protein